MIDNCIVKQIANKRHRKIYAQCLKWFFTIITYIVMPFLCIDSCYACYINPIPILIYAVIMQLFGCCILLFTLNPLCLHLNDYIKSLEIDILELEHDVYKK